MENNTTFRSKVKVKFNPQPRKFPLSSNNKDTAKLTYVSPIPPPIPAKSSKEVKEISKYFKKTENPTMKKSYTQASSNLINNNNTSSVAINTLKIKEAFSKLSNKKINSIQKVINRDNAKPKPRINMTTKGPSHKQIIIPMTNELGKRFTKDSASHITNINCILKNIKSNICADYISSDNKGVNIITNNVASSSNLQEIEKYVKQSLNNNSNSIAIPRLLQSKSYLKIVGILYYINKSSSHITTEDIECILKNTHIFNEIILTSRLRIIKVSSKSDMAIVWIDIWDNQNDNNAKKIINRRFNIGNIIATVRGANMNPSVPQCKNCWKWGHTAGVCRIQGSKYAKCNSPHLMDNHWEFAWCCKANSKINLPRLEMKKGEPCPHLFKCLNCKGPHTADSVEYPFWKHYFNKE